MTSSNRKNLTTREDLSIWLDEMLPKDFSYLEQSGAGYLKEIRCFESVMRPMWGLFPKYAGRDDFNGFAQEPIFQDFQELVKAKHLPCFSTENRQIAVEVGVLGYVIGTFGEKFLGLFSPKEQDYLLQWLNGINTIDFPPGNWYFFLVLVNTALKKSGADYSEIRLQAALDGIESFYLGEGWYSDGDNQQRDYYVSFAFHFYGLLYCRFGDSDIAERFQGRALRFAEDFKYWFDSSGRSLPFGRSMTYRFAHVSFWAALVVTGVYRKATCSLGEIKQMLLDNLRFWQKQPITLPGENNLSIGYGYNNLILSEDYNAPASPMWAFKSFIILELPDEDIFWQISEQSPIKAALISQPHAGFILQTNPDQTIALSCSQYAISPGLYHGREKYSKFAYSTYFGFNIVRDNQGLEQFAIDSTLAFSLPNTNQFQARGPIISGKTYDRYSVSQWQVYDRIQVITYLLPVDSCGHIRIHEIFTPISVVCVEGGFPLLDWNQKYHQPELTERSCILQNNSGYSQITDLLTNRKPRVTQQGPNSNIYSPEKNAVPTLFDKLSAGRNVLASYVVATPQKTVKPSSEVKIIINEKTDYFCVITDKIMEIKKERF